MKHVFRKHYKCAWFTDPVFSATFYVYPALGKQGYGQVIKRWSEYGDLSDAANYEGWFGRNLAWTPVRRETGMICLILLKPGAAEQVDVVVHELTHAAVAVLDSRGVRIDARNDETFAYYLQWLVRESLKATQLLKQVRRGRKSSSSPSSGGPALS